jgi:hypothetical protein
LAEFSFKKKSMVNEQHANIGDTDVWTAKYAINFSEQLLLLVTTSSRPNSFCSFLYQGQQNLSLSSFRNRL